MALLSELKVGEIYSVNGSRARLEWIGVDQNGDPMIVVARGRSFERRLEIPCHPHRRDWFPAVGDPWPIAQEKLKAARLERARAQALSERLSASLAALGLQGGSISRDGTLSVYGDLAELERLADLLEESSPDSPSALSGLV